MIVPVSHADWQVLRAALRTPGISGRNLRVTPSRRTKDGSFLTDLVRSGLLRVIVPADDPFQATYVLTPDGEHAAEFGEWDKPFTPSRNSPPG